MSYGAKSPAAERLSRTHSPNVRHLSVDPSSVFKGVAPYSVIPLLLSGRAVYFVVQSESMTQLVRKAQKLDFRRWYRRHPLLQKSKCFPGPRLPVPEFRRLRDPLKCQYRKHIWPAIIY